MRKIRYILFFAITSIIGNVSYAQQDPQLTLFMFNDLFYNPAFAGVEGVTKVTLLDRHQWIGYQPTFDDGVSPTTQVLSMTAPIYRILPGTSGFGLNVVNDQLGLQNNLQINGSFSYHLGIKKTKLSLGVRFGMYSQSFGGNFRPLQPETFPGRESQVRPDMALGAFFRAEKMYAGISFNHMIKAKFDFGLDSLSNALENHAVITGGYIYKVNFDMTIRPSILVMTDFNQYTFIIGGYVEYKEKINVGLSFRQSEDINLILGYNFLKDKSLSVHYSIGYVYKDQEAKNATSHELMLGYRLPVSPGGGKKIVRTPRFRH
ncbi:MAG: type IX secretion system membrane protein PorP/SprF [Cyclobacteriaceae bacterium]|nr:type IX secretion system membrane protein PorP/SprF [Cyclobacteriaceae bacterium]